MICTRCKKKEAEYFLEEIAICPDCRARFYRALGRREVTLEETITQELCNIPHGIGKHDKVQDIIEALIHAVQASLVPCLLCKVCSSYYCWHREECPL